MNPFELTFSFVRLCTKVTGGARSARLASLPSCGAGVRFERGVLIERDESMAA